MVLVENHGVRVFWIKVTRKNNGRAKESLFLETTVVATDENCCSVPRKTFSITAWSSTRAQRNDLVLWK